MRSAIPGMSKDSVRTPSRNDSTTIKGELSMDFVRIVPAQHFTGTPAPAHRPYAFYADAFSLHGRTIADCYQLVKGIAMPPKAGYYQKEQRTSSLSRAAERAMMERPSHEKEKMFVHRRWRRRLQAMLGRGLADDGQRPGLVRHGTRWHDGQRPGLVRHGTRLMPTGTRHDGRSDSFGTTGTRHDGRSDSSGPCPAWASWIAGLLAR